MRSAGILFILSLFLSSAAPVIAAPKETIPAPGKFLSASPVSADDAKHKCAVDPGKDVGKGECRVLLFKPLGAVGEERLSFAWYRRSGAASLEQLVLFSSGAPSLGEDSPFTPVWTDIVESYESSGPVTDAALHHGPLGDFLELKYSTGGTAGVWSEYFLKTKTGWKYLQQLEIEEDALKCLPKGYGIQTKNIDLEAGAVEVFAPNADDPVCCPSGLIHLKLKLAGDSLRGEQCRFEKK